jgi:hypothetical protein
MTASAADLGLATDALAPASLDTVMEVAALQTRMDRKYLTLIFHEPRATDLPASA